MVIILNVNVVVVVVMLLIVKVGGCKWCFIGSNMDWLKSPFSMT